MLPQNILIVSVKKNSSIFQFLSVQTIEQVYGNATGTGKVLWYREKYWQNQLFT